jgi:hypothetical protein
MTLRMSLPASVRIVVTLLDRRRRTVAAWRLGSVGRGTLRRALRLPSSLRPGRYRVFVSATADARTERQSRPLAILACARSARR